MRAEYQDVVQMHKGSPISVYKPSSIQSTCWYD